MTGPDLLESGSARTPTRRRLTGWIVAVAIIAGAAVLAARAGGDPPPERAVAPVPSAVPQVAAPRDPPYLVYDVAVSGTHLYALAGRCRATRTCGYRLLSWDGARWSSTRLPIPRTADLPGRLLVTGRYLSILDGTKPGAYVSTDGGRTFRTRPARTGPPLAAVPAGLTPELGDRGVDVFDPATGVRRPLATQPMTGLRSVTVSGRTIRAVARQGPALVVATSTDAGRSWTRAAVTTVTYRTPELLLVPSTGDSAYLVVTRPLAAGEPGVAEIWHSGPAWGRSADFLQRGGSTPRFSNAVSTPTGGVFLADGSSGGVLTYDTGTEVQFGVPPGAAGDPPLVPAVLRTDRTGLVAAITADGGHLLLRHSTEASWRVLSLPA